VKKILIILCLFTLSTDLIAQDSTENKQSAKEARASEKRQRIDAMSKQEEEGVLIFRKQNAFGIQLRTRGYGVFYEIGRFKSPRFANLYLIELTETKDIKEEKTQTGNGFVSNSFVYGKINNFYQFKLGFGQQYILGQKGNKNGIAVMGLYQGGLSLGLLRPYYINIQEGGQERSIKYDPADSSNKFLTAGLISGSSGLGKGWNELEMVPGAFVKTALRFDFGRYNELIQALQIGLSVEAYSKKIEIMAPYDITGKAAVDPKQIFFQGHIAFVFGRRK
jgi:hypothetical protein